MSALPDVSNKLNSISITRVDCYLFVHFMSGFLTTETAIIIKMKHLFLSQSSAFLLFLETHFLLVC